RRERLEGAWRRLAEVQVAQEVDRVPAVGRGELREGGQGAVAGLRHRGRHASRRQSTTARWITTSSSGTSSWKPLRPVFTPSIASTTSWPATTLPNTA